MVNARHDFFARCAVLLLAAAVLTAAAWNRGAEYDEQYTLFLTAGTPRPVWPAGAFPAGLVMQTQSGHAGFAAIARDLRHTDVHPPLYFWSVAAWREVVGDGLFGIRLLSVGFSLGALAMVGAIAARCGIPPALAILLTLGCYGFAYTGGIARGFALVEFLTLAGIVCVFAKRNALTGAVLGAAVLTNYLAVFVAAVGICQCSCTLRRFPARAIRGFAVLPFLAIAGWFFIAQRNSRTGQFPPFQLLPALGRLARYGAANLTGGLPLYVSEAARPFLAGALALGLAALAVLVARNWGRIGTPQARWLILGCVAAPPLGLLCLGIVFDNTPIELRYLSFSAPFIALLVAGAVQGRRLILAGIFLVQMASIAGLILRPETMQPAKATAAAVTQTGDGVVMIPRGNDGVGIVGAFANHVSPTLPLLVIGPDESPEGIRTRTARFHRVVLALVAVDGASQTAVGAMREAFRPPDWRAAAFGFNVVAYERASHGD